MGKFVDGLGTVLSQFQIGVGGTGLRRLRFRNAFNGDLEWNPTTDRTLTLPNRSGTIATAEQYVRELDSSDTALTWYEGNFVSVSPQTYSTIFNVPSGGLDLIGGAIYGINVGFRLIIDGTTVFSRLANASGRISNGTDSIGVVWVPPAKATTSMRLDAYNAAGVTTRELGWRVATR